MKSLILVLGIVIVCAANAMAATWTGVARCRANPPVTDEANGLPDQANSLVGTVMSMLGSGGAVVLVIHGHARRALSQQRRRPRRSKGDDLPLLGCFGWRIFLVRLEAA